MTAISRDLIGRTSPPRVLDVERGHVRAFLEALGDYEDDPAARADFDDLSVPLIPPPTFFTALRPHDAREGVDIDWRKLLHGEQEVDIDRPLRVGDRLTLVQRIADVYTKAGKAGEMDFIVLETIATDASGATVFTARSTAVLKR